VSRQLSYDLDRERIASGPAECRYSHASRVATAVHIAAADMLAGRVGDNLLGTPRLLPAIGGAKVVETVVAAVVAVESSPRGAAHQPTADGQEDR
jgi:malate dehydrogenase (oxaloacetate-decarboxylating)